MLMLNYNCIPIVSVVDVQIYVKNEGSYPMIFDYCHTYDKITNKIEEVLYKGDTQVFNITGLISANGDCTYIYGNDIVMFNWNVDKYHMLYDISNINDGYTSIYVLDQYTAIFKVFK